MAKTRNTRDVMELLNGDARCVFTKTAGGWTPDWFYLGDRRMLRFKDHEWMSVGNLRPVLKKMTAIGENSARFEGVLKYYGTNVTCAVTVSAAGDGPGFVVESTLKPAADIEVLEALTSFECPYEYDGSEHSLTVLGQEPVYKHEGGKIAAGFFYESPFWFYNRHAAARMTAPSYTPLLCHRVSNANGTNPRWITLLGHWSACTFRDMYATPTRKVKPADEREFDPLREFVDISQGLRGYKYIVGGLNWSSSQLKDPNVILRKGKAASQKVTIDFTGDLAGKTTDEWLIAAWQRLAAYSFPNDGRVPAWDLAKKLGIDWRRANRELAGIFARKEIKGLWSEKDGIVVYVDGTRPAAGGHSKGFTLQWLGPLQYQAKLRGDARLKKRIHELAEMAAVDLENCDPSRTGTLGALFFLAMPSARLLQHADPRPPRLENALRKYLLGAVDAFDNEGEGLPLGDYGTRANVAEILLLTGKMLAEPAMVRKGIEIVDFINGRLEADFWHFGCGQGDRCPAGKQIRPIGYGHAITANILAADTTGRDDYIAAARHFANYLVSICCSTFNGSPAEDFDVRGWACGANSGRDQWAEFPPMETCDSLRCVAGLLGRIEPVPAFYDVLFLIARTGLAMLPAARTQKRIHEADGDIVYVPTARFRNERAIYARFPFISYENPWDQTLQAPYQGVEPLQNYMTFGGGIATVADDRLIAIVPQAAIYALEPSGPREVHVWNPTRRQIKTTLDVAGMPAGAVHRIVMPDGSASDGKGAKKIRISVPARAVVKIEVNSEF
ncbi:MAG TPA: hypothetical protein VM223_28805 [Planctomycetota bacterium]|nr:hypothetical protein [Planctomycetota bacterium]